MINSVSTSKEMCTKQQHKKLVHRLFLPKNVEIAKKRQKMFYKSLTSKFKLDVPHTKMMSTFKNVSRKEETDPYKKVL